MGASCDHLDHVKTQLPYAMTVALASIIAYFVAGLFESVIVLFIAVGLVVAFVILFGKLWGERLENYSAEEIDKIGHKEELIEETA